MGTPLTPVTIVPGVMNTVRLQGLNAQALKMTNGTPFDITIAGFGVEGSEIIPAGQEIMLYASTFNAGILTLIGVNNTNVSGNGVVNLVIYQQGEQIPQGTWPVTVPPQVIQATVTTITNLVNIGNSPGTQWLKVQPSDSASPTWTADNSGNLSVFSDNGGTLTALLNLIAGASPKVKLAAAGIVTEIVGSLLVDQAATLNGVTNNGNETIGGTLGVTGATTLTGILNANGSIKLAFGSTLQGIDKNAVTDTLLEIDGNNNVDLFTTSTGIFALLTQAFAQKFLIDANNGVNLTGSSQSANGTQSGNVKMVECIYGTYKITALYFNNYEENTGAIALAFNNSFSGPFIVINLDGACITVGSSSLNLATISATGGTVTQESGTFHPNTIGVVESGATQIDIAFPTLSTTHFNGMVLLIGN